MTTTAVYFTKDKKTTKITIDPTCDAAELDKKIKSKFGIQPFKNIRAFKQYGVLTYIWPEMEANTRKTPYKIEVLDSADTICRRTSSCNSICGCTANTCTSNKNCTNSYVSSNNRSTALRSSLTGSRLSNSRPSGLDEKKMSPCLHIIRKTEQEVETVWKEYKDLCAVGCSDDMETLIKENNTFNNWDWTDAHLLLLTRQIFINIELLSFLNTELSILDKWLMSVYQRYNHVPFHNFKHGFTVLQMSYAIICKARLCPMYLDKVDVISLMIAALCHDLSHPGFTNEYQKKMNTNMTDHRDDPLEYFHYKQMLNTWCCKSCNIFFNTKRKLFEKIKKSMKQCIMATNIKRHPEVIQEFKSVMMVYDKAIMKHKRSLMKLIIVTADVGVEVRPAECSEIWVKCLFQEFFYQDYIQKEEGPRNSCGPGPDDLKIAQTQLKFIDEFVMPLVELLVEAHHDLEEELLTPLRERRASWEKRWKIAQSAIRHSFKSKEGRLSAVSLNRRRDSRCSRQSRSR